MVHSAITKDLRTAKPGFSISSQHWATSTLRSSAFSERIT